MFDLERVERCIFIDYKNGDTEYFREAQWGDYSYDGKMFIVKDSQGAWIALINVDTVESIHVCDMDPNFLEDLESDGCDCDPEECDGCPAFENCCDVVEKNKANAVVPMNREARRAEKKNNKK